MKRIALWGILFTIAFGALWWVNQRRKQSAIYLLRDYPHSASLDRVIQTHAQPGDGQDFHPIKTFLMTDWFNDSAARSLTTCSAAQNGGGFNSSCGVLTGASWAFGHRNLLSQAQVTALEKVLPALPPSAPQPPLNRLLVVSFYLGDTWTTRLYDRANLPAPVIKAHQIAEIRGIRHY